jgi:hypothetical protein
MNWWDRKILAVFLTLSHQSTDNRRWLSAQKRRSATSKQNLWTPTMPSFWRPSFRHCWHTASNWWCRVRGNNRSGRSTHKWWQMPDHLRPTLWSGKRCRTHHGLPWASKCWKTENLRLMSFNTIMRLWKLSPGRWVITYAEQRQGCHGDGVNPATQHNINGSINFDSLVQVNCVRDGKPPFQCYNRQGEHRQMAGKDCEEAGHLATRAWN